MIRIPVVILFVLVATAAFAADGQAHFKSFDAQAKEILGKMTLEEKVGQMCQPDQSALKNPADIAKYFLGSVLSGGGSGPKKKEDYTLEGWTNLIDGYQKQAISTRLAIPLIYGVDAVHGHNNIPGATVFPHNIGLGCAQNAKLVEQIERVTAVEVRATGINWAFAPCVTVPRDIRWGRAYEGFSEDPAIVQPLGAAAVRGFQGAKLSDPLSVVACAKHFAGDGGTTFGTSPKNKPDEKKKTPGRPGLDQGDTRVDEATLRKIHIATYYQSIAGGVATIMPSYNSWNGVKCTGHKQLLTDILKKEMGFEGFLISDYNAIDDLDKDYKKAIQIAIDAGIDMVMLTDKYAQFCKQLKELVDEGKVPLARVDDAVIRILRVKLAMGLLDPKRSPLADRALHKTFGSPEHRAVARQAVRETLVLLKNEKQTLPLKKSAARIHVAGVGADELAMQCGGWTITWQGKMGTPIPGGTSILSAIKSTVSKDTKVTYSKDGTGAEGADVGVIVIGERPYAEFEGDSVDLALPKEDLDAIAAMKKANIPLAVLVVSGRPVILGSVADQADALVALWYPGSEGQGVADVLFGDHKPNAKLSFSWPRAVDQVTVHAGDANYNPLFKLGYGLTFP